MGAVLELEHAAGAARSRPWIRSSFHTDGSVM